MDMKNMYLFIAGLFFLIDVSISDTKQTVPELVKDKEFQVSAVAALDSLYNRNYRSARDILKPWEDDHPDHPVWLLWEAMDFWWVVLNDLYNDEYDDELFARMEKADEAALKLLEEQPENADAYIIRAVANGYMARQHANRERWIRSIRTARTAQNAHENLKEYAPDLADNLFAEGLKKYYAAYLPEAYTVVRMVSWLLPDGDKEEGLELLGKTSQSAIFARPEATYFLGMILLNYEKEYDEAVSHFVSLVETYPNNGYYRRLLIRTLFQLRQDTHAKSEINSTLEHWVNRGLEDDRVIKEELLYWLGRIDLRSGDLNSAHKHFQQSYAMGFELPNRPNRSFHVLSGYYAGRTAQLLGDSITARDYYLEVTRLESEPDVRKRAEERIREL